MSATNFWDINTFKMITVKVRLYTLLIKYCIRIPIKLNFFLNHQCSDYNGKSFATQLLRILREKGDISVLIHVLKHIYR